MFLSGFYKSFTKEVLKLLDITYNFLQKPYYTYNPSLIGRNENDIYMIVE